MYNTVYNSLRREHSNEIGVTARRKVAGFSGQNRNQLRRAHGNPTGTGANRTSRAETAAGDSVVGAARADRYGPRSAVTVPGYDYFASGATHSATSYAPCVDSLPLDAASYQRNPDVIGRGRRILPRAVAVRCKQRAGGA